MRITYLATSDDPNELLSYRNGGVIWLLFGPDLSFEKWNLLDPAAQLAYWEVLTVWVMERSSFWRG